MPAVKPVQRAFSVGNPSKRGVDLWQAVRKRNNIEPMTNAPAYFDIWETVIAAIQTRARELGGNLFEIIEQPARTVAIRAWSLDQPIVQAKINLNGDAIEIKRTFRDSSVPVEEAPEVIEIQMNNGSVRYVHDDLDGTADPLAVADMILAPILESRREPRTEKSPSPKYEAVKRERS